MTDMQFDLLSLSHDLRGLNLKLTSGVNPDFDLNKK